MGVRIQIRDIPEDVDRVLRARAAREGVSLPVYLRRELRRIAETPTPDELLARLRSREPVRVPESSAAALRSARDDRP